MVDNLDDGVTTPPTDDTDKSSSEMDAMYQKRLDDKDTYIKQLEGENATSRETLLQLSAEKGKLEGTIESTKTPEQRKPSAFQSLSEQLQSEEFRDKIDATPSKGVEAILAVLKEQGMVQSNDTREISELLIQVASHSKEQSEAAEAKISEIVQEKLQKFPQQYEQDQEIVANREAIDELKQDEDFKDLSDSQLLKVVKRTGGSGSEYMGSAGMGRRPAPAKTLTKVPNHIRNEVYQIGLQLHGGNEEKAQAYLKRHLEKHGGK